VRVERDFPIRGIREDLPEGERVLWQGAPEVWPLARQAFHIRKVALYFCALLALRVGLQLGDGVGVSQALLSAVPLGVLALMGLGLLFGLAWWSARTTVYAITTGRVVLRVGMALPIMVNLPHKGIDTARVKVHADGSGELPLKLHNEVRLAYAHLWPHARPWCVKHPEPMMRALGQPEAVAQVLAQALAATGGVALTAHEAAPSSQAAAASASTLNAADGLLSGLGAARMRSA
jgi:Bacterial PH domain